MQKKIETAYLHIGFSKTGTASLQRALANSRRKLRGNGILYPGRSFPNHNFLAYSLTSLPELQPKKNGQPVRKSRLLGKAPELHREMEQDIEAFSGGVMIVSAELFDRLDRENCRKVVEYFSQYCNKMTVCAYVRDPFDFTVSLIQKKVNNLPVTIEHLERSDRIDTLLLNKERLSVWIDEAGLGNMLPVRYDRERLIGRSTVTDFLARTEIDGALVEIPPGELNASLTMTGMFVKNEMNKRARTKGFGLGRTDYLSSLPGPRFLPSEHFAEAIRQRCREDRAWLSATFAIDFANGSGGHRGPWQDYFTDEVKTVLKDMLDRGCRFGSAIEEQVFREVAEGVLSGGIFTRRSLLRTARRGIKGILSGGIFTRKDRIPPSPVASEDSGREIRRPGIDDGKSRAERDRQQQVQMDRFLPEAGNAWEDPIERQRAIEDRERQNLKERQLHRAAEEAAQDKRRRPKGIAAFFARLTGKARRIEKEIAGARAHRIERNAAEWAKLGKYQLEERQAGPERDLGSM
ncbi:MAG: hypothetical protein GDA41_01595 [Rhodospirillales bacterium]|nr:hypothetical protein [Rhodospirillales bacterium]